MWYQLWLLASVALSCEGVYVTSSFWAPLVDPRILGYRVEVPFSPDAGRGARAVYTERFGYGGEKLIERLGNGVGLENSDQVPNNIKVIYTHPTQNNLK